LLEGQGILADVFPPDILNGARALAVNSLDLVLSDDDVLQGSTVLEDEDGVLVASFSLTGARD
jgi:hypothetical protein